MGGSGGDWFLTALGGGAVNAVNKMCDSSEGAGLVCTGGGQAGLCGRCVDVNLQGVWGGGVGVVKGESALASLFINQSDSGRVIF